MVMKTFKDLDFKEHGLGKDYGVRAVMEFPDGSKISVLGGSDKFYSSKVSFEMMSNRSKRDGVRGWLSEKQITRHMRYIQQNPLK
jgi:hypothetical protein